MRNIKNLIVKEVKDLLRDPKVLLGMILVPLIMFPLMGATVRYSMKTSIEAIKGANIAVLDLDKGEYARDFILFLTSLPNITTVQLNYTSVDNALEFLSKSKVSSLIVIPEGFSYNISHGVYGALTIYAIIEGFSMSEISKVRVVESVIEAYSKLLSMKIITKLIPQSDPQVIMHPLNVKSYSIFRGITLNVPPSALSGFLMSQSVMMPVVVMILIIFAMQIAATSIPVEKEQKTLETLLSLPVSRLTILAGKLVGSVVIAAIGAASYMVGFKYYMDSIMFAPAEMGKGEIMSIPQISIITPQGYLLLGLILFLTILSALALAIILAVFAEDVRSAQALIGYLYIVIFIPTFIMMFSDISLMPLPLKIALYAIPFSHPIIAVRAIVMQNYHLIIYSAIYLLVFTLAVLYIAAKIFSTERIITAKVSFRRKPRSQL